jgi:hypothetical protein
MAIASMISGGLGFMGAQQNAASAERAAEMAGQRADIARADLSGWQQGGLGAIKQLSRLMGLGKINTAANGWSTLDTDPANAAAEQKLAAGEWTTDPGYQFRMQEGTKALERGAAARTGVLNGAQQKALTGFGQDLGSEEYGNVVSRLFSMAGLGGQAAGQQAGASSAAGAQIVPAMLQAGNARQSGFNSLASGVIRADNNAQKWASRIWGFGG